MSIDWRSLARPEIEAQLRIAGLPKYRAEQIFRWFHARGVASFDQMSDIPLGLRDSMSTQGSLTTLEVDHVQRSRDGTRKLRFRLSDGGLVESVIIPEEDRLALCVSSQVGCALDCAFCATATLGFRRQMTSGEIVEQVWRARALLSPTEKITNLVFMGMGEPLHNYDQVVRAVTILTDARGGAFSPRRITLSTAGLVPGIERYAKEPRRANLAISLNATTDGERDRLMPINRKWNLERLLRAARAYPLEPNRRLTFEYVLLAGVNDSIDDARRLPKLLHGLRCKVNLIPWNPFVGSPFLRPEDSSVARFQKALRESHIDVYVRRPRGDDIDAACGQLAARPVMIAGVS